MAYVRKLADRAAPRLRDGQRREERLAPHAERRVPARGARGGARSRARGLAAALARSRSRDRGRGGVLDLCRHLAAQRSARQGLGAALGYAHLTPPSRTAELAGKR